MSPLSDSIYHEDQKSPKGATSPPICLPGALVFDDLTDRAVAISDGTSSLIHRDPVYSIFFMRLFRGLHRRSPRHLLLIRERGVGEQAVLLELARRTLLGQPAFLANQRLVAIDLRHVAAEELSATLAAIFSTVSQLKHAIICIDAIARLLRSPGMQDHRAALLSALSRCRCRVIGILSPHEYEELVSGDVDARELFSVLSLHEPSMDVATELVQKYAAGLEVQFEVKIDGAAARRAVALGDSCIFSERLPSKAVRILRSICEDIHYERSQESRDRREVTESDVSAKICRTYRRSICDAGGCG